jgi:hypothetical protein
MNLWSKLAVLNLSLAMASGATAATISLDFKSLPSAKAGRTPPAVQPKQPSFP